MFAALFFVQRSRANCPNDDRKPTPRPAATRKALRGHRLQHILEARQYRLAHACPRVRCPMHGEQRFPQRHLFLSISVARGRAVRVGIACPRCPARFVCAPRRLMRRFLFSASPRSPIRKRPGESRGRRCPTRHTRAPQRTPWSDRTPAAEQQSAEARGT